MDWHGPKRSPMVQNSQKSIICCSILQFISRGALNSIPWSWFQRLSNKRPSAGFGWGVPSLPFFLKVLSQQHLIAWKKNPKSKTTFIKIFEVIYFFPLFLCCCKGVESVKSANFNARGIEITNFRSPQPCFFPRFSRSPFSRRSWRDQRLRDDPWCHFCYFNRRWRRLWWGQQHWLSPT